MNSSSTCSNLPSYPFNLHIAAGGVINGTPIICGGYSSGGIIRDSCYVFDKSKNSWKFHCSLMSKRSHHGFTVLKDALFITGGYYGSFLASSEYIYANGTVESGPNLPEARHEQCMVTLHDGKVMILGAGSSLRKNVMILDPNSNLYTTGPSLSYGRNLAACTLFNSALHNNRPVVLVAGGQDQATAEVYDYTIANQWQTSIHLFISNTYVSLI